MRIITFRDKRLRRYFHHGDRTGLPPDLVPKLRSMLSFLELMADESEIATMPHWRAHRLTGELDGYWSLSLTRNWRLIFQVDGEVVVNVDLIDYH